MGFYKELKTETGMQAFPQKSSFKHPAKVGFAAKGRLPTRRKEKGTHRILHNIIKHGSHVWCCMDGEVAAGGGNTRGGSR